MKQKEIKGIVLYLFDDITMVDDCFIFDAVKCISEERYRKMCRYFNKSDGKLSGLAYLILHYALLEEYSICDINLRFKYDNYKPYLVDYNKIFFNMSHCSKGVLCGISSKNIGVDIQDIITYEAAVSKIVCNKNEVLLINRSENKDDLFTRIWAIKESFVKKTAKGLSEELASNDFSIYTSSFFSAYNCKFFVKRVEDYYISVCSDGVIGHLRKISINEIERTLKQLLCK